MNLNPHEAKRLAEVLLGDSAAGEDDESGVGGFSGGGRLLPGPFGRYRITRLVGLGGMGEVYEAQQETPNRRVAIKVVRPDLISRDALRRFEHETRVLGKLQHPGISPIFEAGRVETGSGSTPYFAMEFVDGRPLTAFAAESKLALRARLELFLQVCEAVEHAHQKGVIHRDLKPSNILVDAGGRPRVMDFGVARATDSDLRATSMHTEVGRLVGTLPYMSPEQVGDWAGDAGELDTRSDVYSLGVVLYELLAGRLPYEVKGVGGGRVADAVRAIRESDPAPLSSVDRVFRGDLETIVGRALEKERGRRYQSVGELGADIRRHLRDEPIVARRPSGWYQFRKFARRNKGAVGAGLAAVIALAVGAIGSVWFGIGELQARRAADISAANATRQAGIATATTEFMADAFAAASPEVAQGRTLNATELLDSAAEKAGSRRYADPALRAAIQFAIGRTYRRVGEPRKALAQLESALAIRTAELGADHPETLHVLGEIGLVRWALGERDLAIGVTREVLATRQRLFGRLSTDALRSQISLGVFLLMERQTEEAAGLLEEVADLQDAGVVWGSAEGLSAMQNLAALRLQQDRLQEAEAIAVKALEEGRRVLGAQSPDVIESMSLLAGIYLAQQRTDEAVSLCRDTIAVKKLVFGPMHADTIQEMGNLAGSLDECGRSAEAEVVAREVYELQRSIHGESHPATVGARVAIARTLRGQGKLNEAMEIVGDIARSPEDPKNRQARPLARRLYGEFLMEAKRYPEAETELLASLDFFQTQFGETHPRTRLVHQTLVDLYEAWGMPDKAALHRPSGAGDDATSSQKPNP